MRHPRGVIIVEYRSSPAYDVAHFEGLWGLTNRRLRFAEDREDGVVDYPIARYAARALRSRDPIPIGNRCCRHRESRGGIFQISSLLRTTCPSLLRSLPPGRKKRRKAERAAVPPLRPSCLPFAIGFSSFNESRAREHIIFHSSSRENSES